MPLEPIQQILTLLQTKKNILITTRANPSGDSIAAALAFYLVLKKLGKKVSLRIDNAALALANKFDFLPAYQNIASGIENDGKIIVEFNLKGGGLRGLTYHVDGDNLAITILPDDAKLRLDQPIIRDRSYAYDLAITVDTSDLESLGKIYDEHREFFYDVPIINIDHQADNEHFGELNLVELTAVSTTEIIYNLLEVWQKSLIDKDIATCLLAGIIGESKSFQTPNITPRTLSIASELIGLGAERELIVERIYGNKPIGALQMWGRALVALHTEPDQGMVWSAITARDFTETATNENDLHNVIEELLMHAPAAKLVILFYPKNNSLSAIIHTHRPTFDLRKILSPLAPSGARNLITCQLPDTDAVNAIQTIKQIIRERAPREEILPNF